MRKRDGRRKRRWLGKIGTTILLSPLFLGIYTDTAKAVESHTSQIVNIEESKESLADTFAKQQAIASELFKKAALNQLKARGYYDSEETNVKDNDKVRVMIRLKEKPAVKKTKQLDDTAESTKKVQELTEDVIDKQETVQSKVEALTKSKVIREFGLLINGFSIEVNYGDIEKLEKMEEIESVHVINVYTSQDASANDMADIKTAWETYKLKGEKTIISIIDSGMDPSHQDLKLSKDTENDLDQQEATQKIKDLGYGKYFSDKVPFGHNYADESEDILDQDTSMHGQHVAGIAAANGKVKGVAPEAQLLAMKVFSNNSYQSCLSDDVIAAIEDSVSLGADVINMSLGINAGSNDPANPEQQAIQAASDAGVLCVVAAGNASTSGTISGAPADMLGTDDQSMISSPAVASAALSVASVENTTVTRALFHVDGVQFSGGSSYNGDLRPFAIATTADYTFLRNNHELIDVGGGSKQELTNLNVTNKIAMIHGDTTNHAEKVANVKKAGAVAALIYEDARYLPQLKDLSYPTMCVFTEDGERLIAAMRQKDQFSFEFREEAISNYAAGKMSDFSSWGPTPTLDFKPEITAPGGDIYSLANANSYQSLSGTSMASPFVAGAEALIYQSVLNDKLDISKKDLPQFAKTSLMNTATPLIDHDHIGTIYSPRQQGAGLLNVGAALKNTVSVTDSSDHDAALALKEITDKTSFKVTLTNYDDQNKHYVFDDYGGVYTQNIEMGTSELYDSVINGATLTTSNQKIEVPAKKSIEVTITLNLPATFKKQQFVEGYIGFKGENTPDLVIPYMGYYGDYDAEPISSLPYTKPGSTPAGYLMDAANEYVLGLSNTNLTIDPDRVAISPNGDGQCDTATPLLFFYRNYSYAKYEIVDANDQIIKKIYEEKDGTKNFFDQNIGKWRITNVINGTWDGKVYDTKTGTEKIVPDGQYKYKITTKSASSKKEQVTYYPVKVDTHPPVIKGIDIIRGQGLVLEIEDDGAGVNELVGIEINDKAGNAPIVPVSGKKNTYFLQGFDQLLDRKQNFIRIETVDNAFNVSKTSGNYYDANGQLIGAAKGLNLINLTDNSVVFSDSYSYDKNSQTYTIKGTYLPNTELYVNSIKTTTGDTGAFTVAVPIAAQNTIVFSEDAAGKNLLATYHFRFEDQSPTLELEGINANKEAIAHSELYHLKGKTNGIRVEVNNQSAEKSVDLTSSLKNGEFEGDIPLVFGENKLVVTSYGQNGETTTKAIVVTTADTTTYTGDVVVFDQLSAGGMTTNATSSYYNAKTKELLITGKLKYPIADFRLNEEKVDYDPDTLTFSYTMKNIGNGKHALKIYAQDDRLNDGRPVMNYSYPILVDAELPSMNLPNLTMDNQGNYVAYTNQNPYVVRAEINDNLAGYSLYINLNNAYNDQSYPVFNEKYYAGRQATTVDYPIEIKDGVNYLQFELLDRLNNYVSKVVTVDYHKVSLASPVIRSKQTTASQVVTLHVDPHPEADLYYSIDGNTWSEVSNDLTIADNKSVYYKYKDRYGNESDVAKYEITTIQNEVASNPSIQLEEVKEKAIKVTLGYEKELTEEEIAVHHLSYSLDEGKTWQEYKQPFEVVKDTTLYVRTEDQAGNTSEIVKEQLSLTEKNKDGRVATATESKQEKTADLQLLPAKTKTDLFSTKTEKNDSLVTPAINEKEEEQKNPLPLLNEKQVEGVEGKVQTETLPVYSAQAMPLADKAKGQLLTTENKVFPTTNDHSSRLSLIIGIVISGGVAGIFLFKQRKKNE